MKKPDELWKFPDGSQLSRTVFEATGERPGDTLDMMRQMFQGRTLEIVNNLGVKGSQLLGDRASDANNEAFQKGLDEENKRTAEQQRQEQQRIASGMQQEKTYAEMTWQEKKDFDEKMIEKRQQDEAANRNILGGMTGLLGFGAVLGFGSAALSSVGGAMSGPVSALNTPMMLTSNNGGGMTALARGAFDILGPGNDRDIRIDGPNRTTAFTAGAPTPEMGLNSPLNPLNPTSPMNRNMFTMGPGMAPSGMA